MIAAAEPQSTQPGSPALTAAVNEAAASAAMTIGCSTRHIVPSPVILIAPDPKQERMNDA
jgi:hypothetical protein